jgi:hypothetical protein
MFSLAVAISAILVIAAVVMTVMRWREEGRRAADRAGARHTALARAKPIPSTELSGRETSR